jgi:two-component system, OmpR family, phosphate regulon sensor histidine kinase PhoR
MTRSLYWKIIIPFALLVLIGMLGLGLYTVHSSRADELDHLRSYLINEAWLVSDDALPGFENPAVATDPQTIARTTGDQIKARVTIIARDGTVLGDNYEDPSTLENHANRPEVIAALSSGVGVSTRFSVSTRQNMMYAAVPIQAGGSQLGVARVSLPLTDVENSVGGAIRTIAWATAIAGLAVALGAALIARMITRPLRKMTRAALGISAGQFERQLDIRSGDELGRLGRAFDKMSANLKAELTTLTEERRKLLTILSSVADGVILAGPRTEILVVNPAAESLFKFKSENSIGRPLIEVIFNHEIEQLLKKTLATNEKQSTQMETISGRFLQVLAVPLKMDGTAGALLLFQDLTELRSLQTMRREFVGNVSHELRTPLAAIKAIVETLQGGAIDEPVARDFLNKVNSEVDSLTQIVNELIELSRIETGKTRLDFGPADLNAAIEEVVVRLSPQAERKQLSITKELQPDLPLVEVDLPKIEEVITNILHNAVKFTPPGGQINLRSRSSPDSVVIEIKDSGIGISAADLPHIFERFFKADKSRSGAGSGLGLAISKHIIQAHVGEIRVESELGKGSIFSFRLPLKNKKL